MNCQYCLVSKGAMEEFTVPRANTAIIDFLHHKHPVSLLSGGSRRQLFPQDHRFGRLEWREEQRRAKGTILHEFPLSPAPNKIVKGLKVNGGDGVAGRNKAK